MVAHRHTLLSTLLHLYTVDDSSALPRACADTLPFSERTLHPVAALFIEELLLIVHPAAIQVCIMVDVERSNKVVIRPWLCVRGDTLPDQKNLQGEALDIVTVFHYRNLFEITQLADFGGSGLFICCLLTFCTTTIVIVLAGGMAEKKDLAHY